MRATRQSAVLRVAAALWIVAGAWYLGVEAVVAQGFPGYSYSADYISDLGRPWQSPLAAWMNGAFIVQGLAFAVAASLVVTVMRPRPGTVAFLGLAWVYGLGCVVVGVFPSGGADAVMHVRGATAAIVAGNLAVLTAGVLLCRRRCRALGVAGVALGAAGLVCGGVVLGNAALDVEPFFGDGAWERGAVDSIIAWQLLAGVLLWIRPSRCATDSGSDSPARL
ncbi:DUF998 domain-containing protein [Mycolicibacterium pyrenivorans]|uniref:DUF998 domain-containing protein n=1 Tax=Mycolicibacterium pyrenivorans TaxID=187102 RepID=UPI0021F26C5D|nr:DUF998 domain-containing protein [Mycolicibacterium pyrenivorans]MCV7154372.1 DUF998 domain-containing protein [Mycolicibacterium pyrenivorans]